MKYGKFIYGFVFLTLTSLSAFAVEMTPMMQRLSDPDYEMSEKEKAFQQENGKKYYSILQQHKTNPQKGIMVYAAQAEKDCEKLKEVYFDAISTDVTLCKKVAKSLPALTGELFSKGSKESQTKFYDLITKATLLQAKGQAKDVDAFLKEQLQ